MSFGRPCTSCTLVYWTSSWWWWDTSSQPVQLYLGASYCRRLFKKGGTCIYVLNNLNNVNLNLDNFCYDKDIEACAISVNIKSFKICTVTIYRSPSGNYETFLSKLELILHKLYKDKVKIVCGDFNVNYMVNCHKKANSNILSSFNLWTTITFPTRIGPNSISIIDNIFINEQHFTGYEVTSISNGLSDHEAQLFIAYLPVLTNHKNELLIKRNINYYNIAEFKMKLIIILQNSKWN
jgi:hypothetical protein